MKKSMNRESMVFYRSYMEAVRMADLSPELRCEFYEAIVMYATTNEMPNFSTHILEALFVICKANIDANIRKYDEHMKAVENGKKGGAPKGNKNAAKKNKKKNDAQKVTTDNPSENERKTTPKTTINVNENANENVNENENESVNDNINETSSFLKENKKKKLSLKKKVLDLDLGERRELFRQTILPYVDEYGEKSMQDFFDYWRETNRENTLMRFEMEKSWVLTQRLESWMEKRKDLEWKYQRIANARRRLAAKGYQ